MQSKVYLSFLMTLGLSTHNAEHKTIFALNFVVQDFKQIQRCMPY